MTNLQVFAGKSLATSTQFCLKGRPLSRGSLSQGFGSDTTTTEHTQSHTYTHAVDSKEEVIVAAKKEEEKRKKARFDGWPRFRPALSFFLLGLWVLFLASGNWSQWSLIAHCCNKQQHLRKVKCPFLTKYFNNFYMGRLDLIHMLNL